MFVDGVFVVFKIKKMNRRELNDYQEKTIKVELKKAYRKGKSNSMTIGIEHINELNDYDTHYKWGNNHSFHILDENYDSFNLKKIHEYIKSREEFVPELVSFSENNQLEKIISNSYSYWMNNGRNCPHGYFDEDSSEIDVKSDFFILLITEMVLAYLKGQQNQIKVIYDQYDEEYNNDSEEVYSNEVLRKLKYH